MGKSRVNKVFWTDPYLTELETSVTGVDGDDVTVECTIFFAFSGGQESDASNHRRRPRPSGPERTASGSSIPWSLVTASAPARR